MNHSTENSTNFRESKVKWKENFWKKIFENLGILHEVVLFGNCGKCRFIRYCKLNENLNRTFRLNGKYPLFFLKHGFSRCEANDFSVKPVTGLTTCAFFIYSKVRAGIYQWTVLYLSFGVYSPLDAVDIIFSSLYMTQYVRLLLYAILRYMVSMQ